MNKIIYEEDKNGFSKQKNPKPFRYDEKYKEKQSTNPKMSWLRIGWLISNLRYSVVKKMNVVDIGSGNGCFISESKDVFKRIVPYDLCGESITKKELYQTHWDMIIMSDVLEHYKDIDDLWKLKFNFAFISFPEFPQGIIDKEIKKWRHWKPNEHIYNLTLLQFVKWIYKNNCITISCGHPEDLIRKRWNELKPNISTILFQRVHKC